MSTPETVEVLYNDHYAGFREDPTFHREATRLLAQQISPRIPPPARLLDVGCGNGDFLALARDAGYTVDGVDVSPTVQELCKRRGLVVRVGDLRSPALFTGDVRFDLITFWDVIEHLPDPRSFLLRAHDLLRPGGGVLIKTPRTSRASLRLAAALPRLAGALLQSPSHVQYFEQRGLVQLLDATGFQKQAWLTVGAMRAAATGGPLRRRAARRVVQTIRIASGDGNLLVLAQKT